MNILAKKRIPAAAETLQKNIQNKILTKQVETACLSSRTTK